MDLLTEPSHTRKYYPASPAGLLFDLVCRLIVLIIPFIIVYYCGNFWIHDGYFHEQPRVKWLYKAMTVLRGEAADGTPGTLAWSTMDKANDLFGNLLVIPHLEYRPKDANGDTLLDQMEFYLRIPLEPGFNPTAFDLLLFMDYEISSRIKVKMESLCHFSYDVSTLGNSITVEGDLGFSQAIPLFWTSTVYNRSFFAPSSVHSIQDILIPTLLDRYSRRNFSTPFLPRVYSTAVATETSDVGESGLNFFDAQITIHIVPKQFWYFPGPWEILKFGWLQYFCFAWIVWWIVYQIRTFCVKLGLFTTKIVDTSKSPRYQY